MARRLLIKGTSGSGKTTLARKVAERLALPLVELDALHHGPNWTAASPDVFRERLNGALDDARGWVVDGNYDSKLGRTLIERADAIVWLDLPLATKLVRLAQRSARRYVTREELWHGNRETLRGLFLDEDSLFRWTVKKHFEHRRDWPKAFEGLPLTRLRSALETQTWLDQLSEERPQHRDRTAQP